VKPPTAELLFLSVYDDRAITIIKQLLMHTKYNNWLCQQRLKILRETPLQMSVFNSSRTKYALKLLLFKIFELLAAAINNLGQIYVISRFESQRREDYCFE